MSVQGGRLLPKSCGGNPGSDGLVRPAGERPLTWGSCSGPRRPRVFASKRGSVLSRTFPVICIKWRSGGEELFPHPERAWDRGPPPPLPAGSRHRGRAARSISALSAGQFVLPPKIKGCTRCLGVSGVEATDSLRLSSPFSIHLKRFVCRTALCLAVGMLLSLSIKELAHQVLRGFWGIWHHRSKDSPKSCSS